MSVALLLVTVLSQQAPAAEVPLRFTVIPSIARDRQAIELQPVTDYLAASLGRPVTLVVAPDYDAITGMLARGETEIALLFPLAFARAEAAVPGLQLLACSVRQGKAAYRGYWITARSSGVTLLEQLRGKRLAFVDHSSTSGFLFPVALLRQMGLLSADQRVSSFASEVQFRKSHDEVLKAVASGQADAGAVYDGALAQAARLGIDSGQLRILARTDPIPHEALVAAPHLAAETREQASRALISLDTTSSKGRSVLRPMASELRFNGFVRCNAERYAQVRALAKEEP